MSEVGVDWREALFSRRTLGVRLGLDRVRAVDEALGRPGEGAAVVQVVGTNGKGSTSAMLAHALGRLGRRAGLYTSPHLHRVGERVRIDGVAVSDAVIQRLTDRVVEAEERAGVRLSFFEVLTLAALVAFAEAGVDVIVLEAGLGGRLDATRVRTSSVTLVTRIGLDHQRYLGDDLESIAAEKAAVLHGGAPAFSVAQDPVVARVLRAVAEQAPTPLRFVEPLARAPLPGAHQRHNAGLALAGLRCFVAEAAAEALDGVEWPARMESVTVGGGRLLFDAAHNLDGIEAIVDHLRAGPPAAIVFGCMADKDAVAMLRALAGLGAPVWWVPPPADGAMLEPPADALELVAERFSSTDDPRLTAARDRELARGGVVLVCGSHFLVARLRARALGIESGQVDSPDLSDPLDRTRLRK